MPDPFTFTPYSTVNSLSTPGHALGLSWLPEQDQERLQAYTTYDAMYWTDQLAYRELRRGLETKPVIVPTAMTVADSTAHYLLKGLSVGTEDTKVKAILDKFLKREKFYSRFLVSKHAGVARGDFILHLVGDPDEDDGSKISLCGVDPASYFPITDPDDPDKRIGVHLLDQICYLDMRWRIKMLTYREVRVGGVKRVSVEEIVYEADQKLFSDTPTIYDTIKPEALLPEGISAIPVYHFKNKDWEGQPFGSSEFRGFERVMQGINQSITDEELALALEGLGVWVTDGGRPVNANGDEVDWVIAPAKVMEVPPGAFFKRSEGVSSVKPMLDHVTWIEQRVHEAAATFRASEIDPQTAASSQALSIRFLPTMAKLEQRDVAGLDLLQQLWFDWSFFYDAYEGTNIGGFEAELELGEKLPMNRVDHINELNNMLDRKIISRKYYRKKMVQLGYDIPDDIDTEIDAERKADIEMQRLTALATAQADPLSSGGSPENKSENKSNNKAKPNESGGTESTRNIGRQVRPARN